MKNHFRRITGTIVALLLTGLCLSAQTEDTVRQAVSVNPAVAASAQEALRAEGPSGLQALETAYANEITAHQKGRTEDDSWKRIAAALNHVGGQYDEDASGLYWYTNLEKAQAAAKASGKPILSLRLLGQLDEDLSCANSRFFRATLYPDGRVNAILRDKFILHWESFRPVPVVTINFGDGRKLVRTITGNSIHYVLTPDGQIVDALPGLYSPQIFARELQLAASQATLGAGSIPAYQKATSNRLLDAWKTDLDTTSLPGVDQMPKPGEELETLTDDARWKLIAALHTSEVVFDDKSRQVIARKFPTAEEAAPLAMSKFIVESPMLQALRNLQATVALDTVKNNYLLRTKILALLAIVRTQGASLDRTNDCIYEQIFLTPKNDPWYGLAPTGVFSGIDQNGETR